MQCPRCQAENRQGRRFCAECGASLALSCPSCGFSNEPGEKFCGGCGVPLSSAPLTIQPKSNSPQSYTPSHLAEKILTSKSALEGERKQVTVLFADLKGSMELLADRDPEEARQLLDPVLERMMEAVHRYEGTVNQVMGDGIMALFGAPLAHEDHAVRACYAALRMQDAIGRYAAELRQRQGLDVQIRVGLNSGAVVVRAIGNDLHMDYTAVGQTTHLAARLEQLARPGTTLLTGDTLRLVEGYVEVNPLGPVPVKGLPEPIEVYELRRAGPTRSRLQASVARGLTHFVGRAGELAQLHQALDRANSSHGQVVAIVGEPGVGKSRLVWEVTHSPRVHGWLVLQAGSVSYGKATSYLPVIDLLKRYCAIDDRDGARAVREKLTGKLLTLDRAQEGGLPALLSLLDVPTEDPQWETLDPPQRRRRTLEAVKRLLLRESQMQPLLVVFEDLHWLDSETQALLDGLVESLPAARLLLLVNYRPEYQHQWGSRTYYTQLRLDPLPPESAEDLLGALLGADGGARYTVPLQDLKRLLIARTEGNPFFLEESVRALVETGVLVGTPGAYRLASHVGAAPRGRPEVGNHRGLPLPNDIQMPATVQAVLAARIDRLSPGDKGLLQMASVVGKDVPFVLLQAIAEPADDELHAAIGRLQAAEFLYETSLYPEREYTFKHALTHEVTYGSLLQDRRRTLHRQIVATIERRYPDRLAEHLERLAHHAVRGDLWGQAVPYLRQAGAKAFARSAHREALASFEQALTALIHLPETRETREQAIDVRFELRNALFPLAEFARIERYLQEAESLAMSLNDQRRLGWGSAYMSGHHLLSGSHATDVRRFAQRVEAIGETLGDVPLQIAAQYYLVTACHISGDYHGAEHACRRLMQLLQGDRNRERFSLALFPAVLSRFYLARTLAERGVFDEGDAHGHEAIRMAEALDHPFSLVWACLGLAYLNSVRGELTQAAGLLERAVAQCHDWNITIWTPIVMASLGHVYAWSGRLGEGVSWLQQALAAYESAGIGLFHSISVVQLGEAYLLADQVEEACACADRAVTLSRQRGERGYEAWALRLLGDMASHHHHPDVATVEAHYGAAAALASELGMRPLVAHCHLGLGTLYAQIGRLEQARAELSTAIDLYRAMEMTFWLNRAEAELAKATQH
jgi:class 3 adenylate cyclase/tetratricopeptide (TPR) repeat protein